MASFLKNFKNLTKPFVDDEDYIEGDEEELEEEEYEEELEEEEYEEPAPKAGFGKRNPAPKAKEYYKDYSEPRKAPAPRAGRSEVRTYAPTSFDEVKDIAQNLLERRAVILNLEDTDPDDTARLLDFMSGVAFALDGQIRRIAKKVYAFAPAGVDFIGFSVDDGDVENDDLYI